MSVEAYMKAYRLGLKGEVSADLGNTAKERQGWIDGLRDGRVKAVAFDDVAEDDRLRRLLAQALRIEVNRLGAKLAEAVGAAGVGTARSPIRKLIGGRAMTIEANVATAEAEEFLALLRELLDEHGEKVVLAGVAMWLLDLIGDDEEEVGE